MLGVKRQLSQGNVDDEGKLSAFSIVEVQASADALRTGRPAHSTSTLIDYPG
jgi:hypothetical protein